MREGRVSRIAWCLTGAGHLLKGSLELALRCSNVSFFISHAGEEVLAMYHLMELLNGSGARIVTEKCYSAPTCGEMSLGRFGLLVVAPATANTVAKCVLGIADTLPTNLFAQAGKALVPSFFLPTDVEVETVSTDHAGKEIIVHSRKIDLENTERLSAFPLVKVAGSLEQLKEWLPTSF